jgi:GntR family transcriptional regulator
MSNVDLQRDLVRSNAGTLHAQLYETLLAQIRSGEFSPGSKLPTEAQLIKLYGVSRMTVRRAVDDLRRDRLVERKPALGTFVREQPLAAKISGLHSLTDEILQLGMTPGSRLLARTMVAADSDIAEQLEVQLGAEVLRLERVRTANERAFYVAESFLNTQVFPSLLEQDYSSPTLSLLETYRKVLGRDVERMTQSVSAVGASPLVAEVFNFALGAPVLRFERTVYLRGGAAVEHVTAHFRGESYKFFSEMA